MNEPSAFHMRDVPRGAEYALKVPDRFRRRRVDLVEEAAAVRLVEDTRETPGLVFEGLGVGLLISILILRSDDSPLCPFALRYFSLSLDLILCGRTHLDIHNLHQ